MSQSNCFMTFVFIVTNTALTFAWYVWCLDLSMVAILCHEEHGEKQSIQCCCNCIPLNNNKPKNIYFYSACATNYIIIFVVQELLDIIKNHDNKNNILCDILIEWKFPLYLHHYLIVVRLCCSRTQEEAARCWDCALPGKCRPLLIDD